MIAVTIVGLGKDKIITNHWSGLRGSCWSGGLGYVKVADSD